MSVAALDSPRAQMKRDLAELARPALVYHAWVLVMLALFDVVILVLEGFAPGSMLILAVLSACTVAGVLIGQGLAIARLRGWFLGCSTALWYSATCTISVPLLALGAPGGIAWAILFLTPIFVSGGVWSLASSRALFAAWVPVIYGTGAIFAIVERDDGLSRWEQGDKWAIWDVSTAVILFLTIALLLVYLVQRERHRLHRWRFAPRSLLAGTVVEKGAARPRLTTLGWVAVVVLGLVLTAGTLFIAPYLFRTGEREGSGEGQGQEQPQQGEESPGSGGSGPGEEAGEQAERAGRALAQAVCPALIGLLLLAGVLSIAWRPLRRLATIELLRRPPFPVSPTTRIRLGWRLIEVGLGDLGIERDPSVDASDLVRRHAGELRALDAELHDRLVDAASIRDRVHYGLGIETGDVDLFVEHAERVFVLATNRIDLSTEAKNAFRDVG